MKSARAHSIMVGLKP